MAVPFLRGGWISAYQVSFNYFRKWIYAWNGALFPSASVSEVIVPALPYRFATLHIFPLPSFSFFPFFFLFRAVIFRGRAAITCSHYHRLFIGLLFFAMYPIVSLHSIFPLLFPVIARLYTRLSFPPPRNFHDWQGNTVATHVRREKKRKKKRKGSRALSWSEAWSERREVFEKRKNWKRGRERERSKVLRSNANDHDDVVS